MKGEYAVKKFLTSVFLCCVALFSGILLSACGEKEYLDLKIQKGDVGSSLYEVFVKKSDGEAISPENNVYSIKNGSNLKIEIYATDYSVNFENFSVKIGENKKQIIKNENYNPKAEGNLFYGYFLIGNLTNDLVLSFDGANTYLNTYTVAASNLIDSDTGLENESEAEKLKIISVCFSGDEYINLYDFLTGEGEKSFERLLNEGYNTFKMKLDGQESLQVLVNYPFKIAQEGQVEKPIKNISYLGNVYTVDLGDLKEGGNYTIIVDCSMVEYEDFSVDFPAENLTYSLSLSETKLNYSKEAVLSLSKLLEDKADYSQAKAYLNGQELERIESEDENIINFKIPSHITPFVFGSNYYKITIDGIVYNEDAYTVKVSAESNMSGFILNPTIRSVDEDENIIGVTGINPDGSQIALAGEKQMLHWAYSYDPYAKGYYTPFDLSNYQIYLNDELFVDLSSILSDSQEDIVENIDDFVLKAKFNTTTNKYDDFKILFNVTSNANFVFRNFVFAEKQVDITYDFEDSRVESVQVAVFQQDGSDLEFESIERGEKVTKTVKCADKIIFRFVLNELVGAHEFKLKEDYVSSGYDTPKIFNGDGVIYLEYYYSVSNLQTFDVQEFTIVASL